MRLVMAGIDYTTADMALREAFVPAPPLHGDILRGMIEGDVDGCALIATCNRTELYISHHGDVPPDGAEMLCASLGRDVRTCRPFFIERNERQAAEHLMRVASGMQSSVPGDSQIITQVRAAIETAREAGTADPLLEALFRSAVAAGKKVKTFVSFAREGASVAREAINAAEEILGDPRGKRVLVVGNGAIGRVAAAELAARGSAVSVTFRDFRRLAEIPEGCVPVEFENRYAALEDCDFVVSATSSPRHTITLSGLRAAKRVPPLFVDLAIPRDIDPEIAGLDGITVLNVDDLRRGAHDAASLQQQFAKADEIIAEEVRRFDLWRRNRRRRAQNGPGSPDFPIFINLHGARALLVGGGKVAARRAEKLLSFGADVHVVSPGLSAEMEKLLREKTLHWTKDTYDARYMSGVTLAVAATDDREANRRVGRDARERGVLVSVADERRECTFYFPAIVRSDYLTAGVISNNGDHAMVKKAAAQLREEMERIDENYQGGEQGERSCRCPGPLGHGRG